MRATAVEAFGRPMFSTSERVNQRLLPRQRRRLRVALGKVALFTADVGPGGFSAEMMHVLPPGTNVSGSISLGAHEFPFTGQVVWAKAGEPRLTQRGRIGVKFTGIENRFFTAFSAAFGDGT